MQHITFANEYYEAQANQLSLSAKQFGIDTKIYNQTDITELIEQFSWVNKSVRGFGYWLWKPYIILDALTKLNFGETLLYTDAGVLIVNDPNCLNVCLKFSDIVCFSLYGIDENDWSKDVLIKYIGIEPDFGETWQRSASYIVIKKTQRSTAFCEEWLQLCKKKYLIDNTNLSTHKNFQFHRNDQSIFSLL